MCYGCSNTQTPTQTAAFAPTESMQTTPYPTITQYPTDTTTAPTIAILTATPMPDNEAEVYVTEDLVRLRSSPSTGAEVLDIFMTGQKLVRVGVIDEWSRVKCDDTEGYVATKYLGDSKPESVTATTNNPPSTTPTQTPRPISNTKRKIAIDAGHQKNANNEQEPIGPGSSEKKPKVASGTSGVSSKKPEYQLTLDISLQLKVELLARGYEVYMIRDTNDVDISNRERAVIAAEAGADILVRVHANGSDNLSEKGILTISPTKKTPYIPKLYDDCRRLSDNLLTGLIKSTGASNRGVWETDTMSGINWSTIPVSIIEMGFMTNPAEDELMQTSDYQSKLVQGIANGIDYYFR